MNFLITIYSLLSLTGATTVCQTANDCGQTIADVNIFCDGYFSCRQATVTATQSLNIGGKRAAELSRITAPSTKCIGAFGANLATFDSSSLTSIAIQFWGFLCGNNAEVHCQIGSECIIDCEGPYGCDGVTVYYYDQITQINISPGECLDSANFGTEINGDRCPNDISLHQ
eukprot:23603_1